MMSEQCASGNAPKEGHHTVQVCSTAAGDAADVKCSNPDRGFRMRSQTSKPILLDICGCRCGALRAGQVPDWAHCWQSQVLWQCWFGNFIAHGSPSPMSASPVLTTNFRLDGFVRCLLTVCPFGTREAEFASFEPARRPVAQARH